MEPHNFKILVVDDEKSLAMLLSRILKDAGYEVESVYSGESALKRISAFLPNLVITDLKMPGMSGVDLLKKVKPERPEIDFIILTAFATVESAVEAMKVGATDYLLKPLKDPDELRIAVAKVLERQSLVAANQVWRDQLADGLPPVQIMFAGMEDVWTEIQQVAQTHATVLIQGESGTGKSLIAKAIHHLSGREGPFVELNCGAIPETLIESELFGHERGAFTGAVKARPGKFELARDGTIFLDEIGEMSLPAQTRLLRVLQDRVFERVGGTSIIHTNARVIAATNQDLEARIQEKLFREDLYYRLNVFPVTLPPLRKRLGAVPVLSNYLMQEVAANTGKKISRISDQSLADLENYDWPGNVRELHNIIERAVILCKGQELTLSLPETTTASGTPENMARKLHSLKDLERKAIEETIRETKGNRRNAAKILGISLRSLQYKLKHYGLTK
ncbi:MAG TPA: sigma-54-dependent Fis family transcriptional regulator [Thermodesulfobacteriaceae bacterium]|nr:sigma-54-dependent Fis family transcriptional regulator [Thermodesulfobacteriaceae bacterium]